MIQLLKVPMNHFRYLRMIATRELLLFTMMRSLRVFMMQSLYLIFGPGEAKDELKKRLEGDNLVGSIVGIVTVEKMTARQIAAKIRQHFVSC